MAWNFKSAALPLFPTLTLACLGASLLAFLAFLLSAMLRVLAKSGRSLGKSDARQSLAMWHALRLFLKALLSLLHGIKLAVCLSMMLICGLCALVLFAWLPTLFLASLSCFWAMA